MENTVAAEALQMILATVLENDLAEELRDRILDPVDMPDTYLEPIAETVGGHISGYKDMDGDGVAESTLPYDDGRECVRIDWCFNG